MRDRASYSNINDNAWSKFREAWKVAVVRGVASVPWYFVNGVPYYAASDAAHIGEEEWTDIIKLLKSMNAKPNEDKYYVNEL